MFENLHDPLAEGGGEIVEDEVRIGFTNSASRGGGYVMPE